MKGNVSKARHQQAPLCAFGQPLTEPLIITRVIEAATGREVVIVQAQPGAAMPDILAGLRALFTPEDGYVVRLSAADAGGDAA
jgi:hypothetical protein